MRASGSVPGALRTREPRVSERVPESAVAKLCRGPGTSGNDGSPRSLHNQTSCPGPPLAFVIQHLPTRERRHHLKSPTVASRIRGGGPHEGWAWGLGAEA